MISYISTLSSGVLPNPRRIAVMGSTGSIGVNCLDVMAANPKSFVAVALAGGRNVSLLAEQAALWRPEHLAVQDNNAKAALGRCLSSLLGSGYAPTIHVGPEGYAAIAALDEADIVVSAQVGAAGLAATYAAVAAGKMVALANKESLVLAGVLLREKAASSGAVILPVDSEHNAIFQCLVGQEEKSVSRLVLTASGGPFRGKDAAFLETVTPTMARTHPNWSMGAKISIDSATMMNKGLEVIEAHHLYGVPLEAIEVLVHPQSVIHSLVVFSDASQLAQIGPPDMRVAISYCLGWPARINSGVAHLNLATVGSLTFEAPDLSVFPCLALARDALRLGKGLPVVLNAANEVAVEAFLAGIIPFRGIARTVETAMEQYEASPVRGDVGSLEAIMDIDRQTRLLVSERLA